MGSFQMPANFPSSALPESSCAYLLQELKVSLFWNLRFLIFQKELKILDWILSTLLISSC